MSSDDLHRDRTRAESFGSIARSYERFRPSYPHELFDDLLALRPTEVLDVGCGTGKVAAGFRDRDIPILGVEPDARMAEVARGRGVPVEVATFEEWDDAGRRFDLIVCGQAWHWVEPTVGMRKAAQVLRPGGTIARFWNFFILEEPEHAAINALYAALPAQPAARLPDDRIQRADPFWSADQFTEVETNTYRWRRTFTADDWINMVSTHSDHQRLTQDQLHQLRHDLRQAIDNLGGALHPRGQTIARFARRT